MPSIIRVILSLTSHNCARCRYHLFQGQAEFLVLRNNKLWNGGMAFYLIARQAIIEGNDATGSSVISMGGGYNFAQHL